MATVTASYNWVSGETVTPAKLNTTAAPTVVVADNEVTTAKILDANVTAAKIADANVTTAKIADANVTAAKLATSAVETAKIADDAVTNDKLSLTANAGEIKKALNADNDPPIFACRAWVNFNGSAGSTVDGEFRCTIRASGNVIKVVRINTGAYEVNFADALPDANYAVVATGRRSTGAGVPAGIVTHSQVIDPTTSKARVITTNTAGSVENMPMVSVAIFR
jgi:hypothetical protein